MKRRKFLEYMAKIVVSITSLSFLSSVYFLKRGAPEQVYSSPQESVLIGSVDEIRVGSVKVFDFLGEPGILVNYQGLHAFLASCPHMGCPVSGRALPGKGLLECPCHGSTFDPVTGERISGPAPRGLTPIKIEVKNGEVYAEK
jgi:nitrite reductase/ring-hydroxylating ferredoxin subunit